MFKIQRGLTSIMDVGLGLVNHYGIIHAIQSVKLSPRLTKYGIQSRMATIPKKGEGDKMRKMKQKRNCYKKK